MHRRPALTLLVIALCACGPNSQVSVGPLAGRPATLTARDFPEEITGLLTSAEADSCGVCVREKRADAFALADEWFSPGTTIRVVGDDGWKVLPGGEMELYFGDASSPTLSFRFHTEDAHLVGIAAEGFTDPQLATRILARTSEETGRESLIVIPFDYGDGESFLFDEYSNRVQVQCQVIADDSGTALQH